VELVKPDIKLVENGIFQSNTYLLVNSSDNICIIFDPGLDYQSILKEVRNLHLRPVAIFSTHGHFDHIGSAANFQQEYGIPFYLHALDVKMAQSANFFLMAAKLKHTIITPTPDFTLKDDRGKVVVGSFAIEYYNFPGHSNGSCVYKVDNYLFTGDIIYKRGLGLESMPRENKTLLKESIQKMFLQFPDDCLVLPGHGSSEYLGEIKTNNLALKNFISI
jgi:hydroxyacylglutathione hydrolase